MNHPLWGEEEGDQTEIATCLVWIVEGAALAVVIVAFARSIV